jgi:DNA mismatch repair protein MutS
MGIIEEYLSLTTQYYKEYGDKTIVLMQVGSFFEVYGLQEADGTYTGSSIAEFSRLNDMMIANKTNTTHSGKPVVMAGFGVTVLEKNVKKLQDGGYTIVVYQQDIHGKNTSRSLIEIISPGTYFGCDSKVMSNNTMCVWLHKSPATKITNETLIIGVSNVDIYTGRVTISQLELDSFHNPCTYDELERLVTVNRPSECILVTNIDRDIVLEIMQFVGLDQVKHHIACSGTRLGEDALNAEKQVYQQEVFRKFFPNHEESFIGLIQDNYVAIQSLTLLLDFVYRHSPYLVAKLSFPEVQASAERLTLANHSLKQLNILDDTRHSGKLRSVSSLLNNCTTTMGKRRFTHIICNPITDHNKLTCIYKMTEHLLGQCGKWEEYRSILSNVCDLEKLSRKIVLMRATPKDLAMIGSDLRRAEVLYGEIKKDSYFLQHIGQPPIDELARGVLSNMEETFDLEACSQIDDLSPERLILNAASNTFIRQGRDSTIDDMRINGLDGRQMLEAIRKYLCSHLGCEKSRGGEPIKIHETAKQNPTLQLTQRRSVLLKTSIKKYLAREGADPYVSLTIQGYGGERCFNIDLSDLTVSPVGNSKSICMVTNSRIEEICTGLQNNKDKLVQSYVMFYNNYIASFQKLLPEIEATANFMALVDLEQCRCYIAHKFNYCRPTIVKQDKAYFDAEGIRHPLIEHLQTRETYVTNDLMFGADTDGLLLYGTNAVGKTSLIKAVGIAVVMAQAGLYVPCKKFTYSPYTRIFTRILGADNIFKGLSTFAVEMSELRAILNQSNQDSLVLGDELCSGTESDSALSIFTAGLESLHQRRCTFLFATHFHEVCRYDEIRSLERLVSMHMAVVYDHELGALTYDRKLKEGPGDSMYGLEVCKSLNLEPSFLERAHDIRTKYNPGTGAILRLSPSKYNSKKLKSGTCEMCHIAPADEIHHLAHQSDSRKDNHYIDTFHKNHPANLMSICEKCHDELHGSDIQHRRVKTDTGYMVSRR